MLYYFHVLKKSFKSNNIYKSNIFSAMIGEILSLYIQIILWTALFNHSSYTDTSLEQNLTYVLLMSLFIKICHNKMAEKISNSIYDGSIEIYFIKPVSFIKTIYFENLGKILFDLIYRSLPVLLIAGIGIKKFQLPQDGFILFTFVISFILGQILYALFSLVLGLSAFWLKANWYVDWFENAVMGIFGGVAFPLWLYPKFFLNITVLVPFRYMGYEILNIYFAQSKTQNFKIILLQLIWILIFFALIKIMWSKALNKNEIYGG